MPKAKGFLSWEQSLQGDTWSDLAVWETLGHGSEAAKEFYALLQMNTCRALVSSLVKHYNIPSGQ